MKLIKWKRKWIIILFMILGFCLIEGCGMSNASREKITKNSLKKIQRKFQCI